MKAKIKSLVKQPLVINKPVHKLNSLPIHDKSGRQLLEDITGVLDNRRELLTAIVKKFPQAHDGRKSFLQYQRQTKKFLGSLLAEMSGYGHDTAVPDPHNEYNEYWKAGLLKWNSISQARLIHFWLNLETILRDYYRLLLAQQSVLPPGFTLLLKEQLAQLETDRRKGSS